MEIKAELFNEKELREFVDFSRTFYENPKTNLIDNVRHKFKQFNNQRSLHIKAYEKDKIIGRVVLNEKKLHLGKKNFTVTQPSDLLTLRDFKNPLTVFSLIKSFNQLDTDLVIHTSNEKSDVIYKNIFKFPILFKCITYGFPISPLSLFSKVFLKRKYILFQFFDYFIKILIKVIINFIMCFNSIKLRDFNLKDITERELTLLQKREVNLFSRNKDFIKWKYLDSKELCKCYKIFKKNQAFGYIFIKESNFNNLKAFCLMDFFILRNLKKIDYFFVRLAIIYQALHSKCDLIYAIGNMHNTTLSNLFKLPFIHINDYFLPHSTPIYISSVKDSCNINDCKDIYFTLADTDYF